MRKPGSASLLARASQREPASSQREPASARELAGVSQRVPPREQASVSQFSRPSVKERVLRLRVGSKPGPFQYVRKVAGILGLAWAGPKQASRSPGSTREALGSPRDAPGAPGKPQDQPRNEQREFQENRAFRPWEAFGGPRGTQNRWGGLAGAKEKSQILRSALGPPPRFEGFLLLASGAGIIKTLLLAPLSRKGASFRVFKLFPSAPSRLTSG